MEQTRLDASKMKHLTHLDAVGVSISPKTRLNAPRNASKNAFPRVCSRGETIDARKRVFSAFENYMGVLIVTNRPIFC